MNAILSITYFIFVVLSSLAFMGAFNRKRWRILWVLPCALLFFFFGLIALSFLIENLNGKDKESNTLPAIFCILAAVIIDKWYKKYKNKKNKS